MTRRSWLLTLPLLLLAQACDDDDCPLSGHPDGDARPERTLTVSGTADLLAQPDQATILMSFSARSKKMKDAHLACQKKVDDFTARMEPLGVKKTQVELGGITYDPDWFYPENAPARIDTFTATESLVIRLDDFARIPPVLDAAVEAGVSSVSNVSFTSTRLPELKKQVRDMAINAAKDKATQLATGLGATLGPVRSVKETLYDSYAGSSHYRNDQFMGNEMAQASYTESAADDLGPVTPGTLPLRLTIEVVYSLD